jgi:hypothetical protein
METRQKIKCKMFRENTNLLQWLASNSILNGSHRLGILFWYLKVEAEPISETSSPFNPEYSVSKNFHKNGMIIQNVPFIVSLSTTAVTGCPGRYGLSM